MSSAPSPNPASSRRVLPMLSAGELRSMASWLGLGDVTVGRKGDLSSDLRRVLG